MKTLMTLLLSLLFALTNYSPSALADEYIREEFNQTYALAPGGTISVKNVNGSIDVSGWDQGQVQLTAVKRGKTQADLDALKIEINQGSDRLDIRTIHPKEGFGRNHNGSVSYTLMVPRNVNLDTLESVNGSVKISEVVGLLRANTVNGSIKVLNAGGSTSAGTVNGSIHVELDRIEARDMKFSTTNGSIKVHVPENIGAEVSATTSNGGIQTDFPLTVQGKFNSKNVRGTLGQGGPLLTLETVNGSIKLLKK